MLIFIEILPLIFIVAGRSAYHGVSSSQTTRAARAKPPPLMGRRRVGKDSDRELTEHHTIRYTGHPSDVPANGHILDVQFFRVLAEPMQPGLNADGIRGK
jgi:hypothetical protein